LAGIIVWGFREGVVIGLVLAVMLFAINYGRIELVREVSFGETYRSNVDRPATERAELRTLSDRVQILRVSGFVFFGSTNRLLERIRRRVEEDTPPRFLLIDLRRVTGVDSSAVVSFVKVLRLAEASGFEVVFTGASDPVRAQLARGGVEETPGLVSFEPDLDRGLERCEDALLMDLVPGERTVPVLEGLPPHLWEYFERVSLEEGTKLIEQGEAPDDVYVLESGRLRVELVTPGATQMRVSTVLPGVIVGEVALYTQDRRTADVVAETPSVVLRLSRTAIERMEAEEPQLAGLLHRWFAQTLAVRLSDRTRALDSLLD
jgi:SulP family sulfate permease